MTWQTALRLGRVSNLPTVWSNALAAAVLAGANLTGFGVPLAALGCSLVYVGGMFLNDAFDRDFDARFRPERPIPSGAVAATTVFIAGFALLACGAAVLLGTGYVVAGPRIGPAVRAVAALVGLVVLYDAWHKDNPFTALLMGLCRLCVYVATGAVLTGQVSDRLAGGSTLLFAYVVGLSSIARDEHLGVSRIAWPLVFLAVPFLLGVRLLLEGGAGAVLYLGFLVWMLAAVSHLGWRAERNVPRAVGNLIAGIALVDALLMLGQGAAIPALLAVVAFALTLVLQRWVPGT